MSIIYDNNDEAAAALRILLQACNLTPREAGDYLGVKEDSVRSAMRGKWKIPSGWFDDLDQLLDDIDDAAAEMSLMLDDMADGGEFTLEVAQTDEQAAAIGLPSAGVHQAIVQRAYADHRDRLKFRLRRATHAELPAI